MNCRLSSNGWAWADRRTRGRTGEEMRHRPSDLVSRAITRFLGDGCPARSDLRNDPIARTTAGINKAEDSGYHLSEVLCTSMADFRSKSAMGGDSGTSWDSLQPSICRTAIVRRHGRIDKTVSLRWKLDLG